MSALRDAIDAAFEAGFDAGWNMSGEGHNAEYTSKSFTERRYREAQQDALKEYLKNGTGQ